MPDDRTGRAGKGARRTATATRVLAVLLACLGTGRAAPRESLRATVPETVYFQSSDASTELVAYLYPPPGPGPHPAIVMLHGRAGPYSSNINAGCGFVGRDRSSPCNAATLSRRHARWGAYWSEHGYWALLVDSFGPRGRGHGYGRHSHDDPDRDDVNERTVRPLDAEAALAWLAARPGVMPGRVMLQGWSNGGSTVLNVMYRQATASAPANGLRFRAALAFYPGCGPRSLISQHYRLDTSLWVFLGSDDEEVSPRVCSEVLSRTAGRMPTVTVFDGATHDFDDPGSARQSVVANRRASDAVLGQSASLLDALP